MFVITHTLCNRRQRRNPRPSSHEGFEGGYVIDEYVYTLIMEGGGPLDLEDVMVVDAGPYGFHAARVAFREGVDAVIEEIAREHGDTLTDEERGFLRTHDGAIIIQDDDGDVSVEYFETRRERDARWKELEKTKKEIEKILKDIRIEGDGDVPNPQDLTWELAWEYGLLTVDTWSERDRAMVSLVDRETDEEYATWWDEDVFDLIEQGFFKKGDIGRSVAAYLDHLGTPLPESLARRLKKKMEGE